MQKKPYLCTMIQTELNNPIEQEALTIERRKALLIEAGFPEQLLSSESFVIAEDVFVGQQAKINEQQTLIEQKDARISALEKENALLKAALDKKSLPKADSHNSSVPPSQDKFGIPHTSSQRNCTKKNGGQEGHKGSTLEMAENPNLTEKHEPAITICPCCGKPVDTTRYKQIRRRQVIDIPTPVLPVVTEHIVYGYDCECGQHFEGVFPEGVTAPVSYGPNVKATVAYVSAMHSMPFKRLVEMLNVFFGLNMSQGTIASILNEMRKYCKDNYEAIHQRLLKQEVLGGDESGIKIDGINYWMWVFQNAMLTYILIDRSRGKKVLEATFPDGLPNTILESDRWSAYFDMLVKDHQLCLAHLLRNTFYFTQLLPKCKWPLDLMELLKESIERKKKGELGRELRDEYTKKLQELLDTVPSVSGKEKQKRLNTFVKGIRKHVDHIFAFLEYEEVEPTNNASERAVRPVKTKMKVSGQFKTKDGADNYASIHSIIQTAQKQGMDSFSVLLDIVKSKGKKIIF